jgi:uncharacterized membrane protein YkoI
MNKKSCLIVSVCVVTMLGHVSAAQAQHWTGAVSDGLAMPVYHDPPSFMSLQQGLTPPLMEVATGLVPLAQVFETINAQEPGTQLDAKTVTEDGRTLYVVRWQASLGRIVIFWVNAETGQIVRRQD